ncbi:MAG TPA: nucleotidyltransferase family protein [Candidatus Solibacter sp.]|nr:nucleotidyltransferase family protein [Candidatus Solibacter sp.]
MPAIRSTREWSLLLAACASAPDAGKESRLSELLRGPIDWKSLLDLADKHGVLPLLHDALSVSPDALPAELKASLSQAYQNNMVKAMLVSRELIRIVDHLASRGVVAMPHKGPALAEILYGDLATRKAGDIDLLVRPRDVARARNAVIELGYTPHLNLSPAEERALLKSGYEFSFDGSAGPNLLELQWAVLPRFYAIDFGADDLFERAMEVSVAGQPMKSPSFEDLFLMLSAHAAKHLWERLLWLCDLARLISRPGLNWKWIVSRAQGLGMVHIAGVTMILANRLLDVQIPAEGQSLTENPATGALAGEILEHYPDANFSVESLVYFRLMASLRERPTDRVRFGWRLAVTPGLSEWRTLKLPAQLFPLYRVIRLTRLVGRLARA